MTDTTHLVCSSLHFLFPRRQEEEEWHPQERKRASFVSDSDTIADDGGKKRKVHFPPVSPDGPEENASEGRPLTRQGRVATRSALRCVLLGFIRGNGGGIHPPPLPSGVGDRVRVGTEGRPLPLLGVSFLFLLTSVKQKVQGRTDKNEMCRVSYYALNGLNI